MEKKIIKAIISPGHGFFQARPEFQALIEAKGYEHWSQIEARTDKDLIAFVEQNSERPDPRYFPVMRGINAWEYVNVVEVDTSRPWYISNYDNAEGISYVEYEVIDEKLNFVRMK